MKLLIFLTFFLIFGNSKQAKIQEIKCTSKSENEIDIALARLLVFGRKDIRFPETPQEMRSYCIEVKKMFERVETYGDKCLNNFGRNSAKVLMHPMKQELRSVCKSGRINKRAKNLIEAGSCGNQGNTVINKNCYIKVIDKFMGALNAPVHMRIPIGCCNYHEFIRCWEEVTEGVPKCTPKVRDFFIKWLGKMFEGITQLLCVSYDESNSECDQIVRETPQRNASEKRAKSILLPLFKIAMSLSDQDFP